MLMHERPMSDGVDKAMGETLMIVKLRLCTTAGTSSLSVAAGKTSLMHLALSDLLHRYPPA